MKHDTEETSKKENDLLKHEMTFWKWMFFHGMIKIYNRGMWDTVSFILSSYLFIVKYLEWYWHFNDLESSIRKLKTWTQATYLVLIVTVLSEHSAAIWTFVSNLMCKVVFPFYKYWNCPISRLVWFKSLWLYRGCSWLSVSFFKPWI